MFLPDKAINKLASAESFEKTELIYEGKVFGDPLTATAKVLDTINPLDLGNGYLPMIAPYSPKFINEVHSEDLEKVAKVPSCGQSSYGYDIRMSDDIRLFSNLKGGVVDPMSHCDDNFISAEIMLDGKNRRYFILPPHSYMLGYTLEYFNIPKNITAICFGKSTYARCGIMVNITVIEPGFSGQIVIEISNSCSLPVKMYVDGGFAQFMFAVGYDNCEVDYSMGNRKYQGQTGMTHAK